MTATLDGYFEELNSAARDANVAEELYRKDALARIKQLELERAFAFRRLNLIKAVASSMTGAKDDAEATARASAAFLGEIGWTGASEMQREVLGRFLPVITALRDATREPADPGDAPREADKPLIKQELAAFEKWYAEKRNAPFLSLMEQEVLELPLVEV